jgi:hypothetical protein
LSPALSPGPALSPSGVLQQPFVAVPAPIDTDPSPQYAEDGIEPAFGGDVLDDLGLGDVEMPEATTGEATELPFDSTDPAEATVGLPETSGTPPGSGP